MGEELGNGCGDVLARIRSPVVFAIPMPPVFVLGEAQDFTAAGWIPGKSVSKYVGVEVSK